MKKGIFLLIMFFFFSQFQAQKVTDATLENGFKNPPNAAKARTWWHWISGNVSKTEIKIKILKQIM